MSILTTHLKMGRAKKHLDVLGRAIRCYRSHPEKVNRVSSYEDLEAGDFVIKTEALDEDTLLTFGLIAGDFIHNVRSSLDHLAWSLALKVNRKPPRRICFPIEKEDSLDAQINITKATHGIPEEAIAIMKSLQPYNSGNAYKSTHLWRLHALWNLDKHRSIASHSTVSDEILRVPPDMAAVIKREAFDNGAIVRIPLALKHRIMRFNPNPGVDVRFGDQEEGIIVSLQDFRDIYEFVSVEVVPRFTRFFS